MTDVEDKVEDVGEIPEAVQPVVEVSEEDKAKAEVEKDKANTAFKGIYCLAVCRIAAAAGCKLSQFAIVSVQANTLFRLLMGTPKQSSSTQTMLSVSGWEGDLDCSRRASMNNLRSLYFQRFNSMYEWPIDIVALSMSAGQHMDPAHSAWQPSFSLKHLVE